jgi:hypothetical protein
MGGLRIKIWHESGWRVDVRPLLVAFLVIIGIAIGATSKWWEAEAKATALQSLLDGQVVSLRGRLEGVKRSMALAEQRLLQERARARKDYFTDTKDPFYATLDE